MGRERRDGAVLRSTERYFEYYEEHRTLFAVLVELGQTDPEVAEIWATSRRAIYKRIAQSLRRGLDAGKLRGDLDIDLVAALLGGMTEFYAFQRFVLADGVVSPLPGDVSARTLSEIWTSGVLREAQTSS